jgi:hypothetical protein
VPDSDTGRLGSRHSIEGDQSRIDRDDKDAPAARVSRYAPGSSQPTARRPSPDTQMIRECINPGASNGWPSSLERRCPS